MELRISYDAEDAIAFNLNTPLFQNRIRRENTNTLISGAFLLALALMLHFIAQGDRFLMFVQTLSIMGATVAFLFPKFNLWVCTKQIRQAVSKVGVDFPFLGTVEIREDGLFHTSTRGYSTSYFGSLNCVRRYPGTTYIMFDNAHGVIINHSKITHGNIEDFLAQLLKRCPHLKVQEIKPTYRAKSSD